MLRKYAVEKGCTVESSRGFDALFNAQILCYVDNCTKTRLSLIWRSVGFVMQMTIWLWFIQNCLISSWEDLLHQTQTTSAT